MRGPTWLLFAVLMGCGGPAATAVTPAPSLAADDDAPPDVLPEPAPPLAAAVLADEQACGPFSTTNLESDHRPLLDDRLRVRFLPGAEAVGDDASGKLEVARGGATLFIGARELYQRGDESFARRATARASFDGGYTPVTITAGDLSIVTGSLTDPALIDGVTAVTHGWFLDPNGDVLDVAVFASADLLSDLPACRAFAEKLLSHVILGDRRLVYGNGAEVETTVSYATYRYPTNGDWILVDSMGIHDFSRLHFRRRGVFPNDYTVVQMALDSHPGSWRSPGADHGTKAGTLLGLPVTWTLTREEEGTRPTHGGWTISETVKRRDHAVASVMASSGQLRDEAVAFAESVRHVR